MKDTILVLCHNSNHFLEWVERDIQGVEKKLDQQNLTLEVGNCIFRCFTTSEDIYNLSAFTFYAYIYLSGIFDGDKMRIIKSRLRGEIYDRTSDN